MNIYHGTTPEAAEKILREGFKPKDSEYMYLGKGVYFHTNPCEAHQYGDTLIEVEGVDRNKLVKFGMFDPIGTFAGYVEDRWDSVRDEIDEGIYKNEDAALKALRKEYIEDAEQIAKDITVGGFVGGYKPQSNSEQVIIYNLPYLNALRRMKENE